MTGFDAVLLYIAWTLLLALSYAFPRVPLVLLGKRRASHWERNEPSTDPAILVRAKGAHLNCVENFALFAAVVCVAALMGKSAIVDALAAYVLYARIGQSLAHLAGTSLPLVLIRATLFLAQVLMIAYMVWSLLN